MLFVCICNYAIFVVRVLNILNSSLYFY